MTTECHLDNENCGVRCTGYEGQHIWKKLHELPKEIECESCADHAASLFTGLHDVVNLGLGKKAYDSKNFESFVNEVNCVAARCKKDGRC